MDAKQEKHMEGLDLRAARICGFALLQGGPPVECEMVALYADGDLPPEEDRQVQELIFTYQAWYDQYVSTASTEEECVQKQLGESESAG